MKRRQYLGLASAGVVGSVSAGCNERERDVHSGGQSEDGRTRVTETATETPQPGDDTEEPTGGGTRFDRVLDAVADLGCDPTGERPCDRAIADAIADGTLLTFPAGAYLLTRPLVVEEAREFGIRGTGEHRRDVRFVHPNGYSELLINVRDGRDCLFERFTAEQTSDRRTNSGLVLLQRDGLVVRDVEVGGFTPTAGGSIDLVVQITDPAGRGLVERFVTRGGAEVGVYPNAWQGFFSGKKHRGTLRLVDCHFEECGSNGVYASRTYGPVQIVGGLYKNNAVSQIRVCGEESFVEDARIVVDIDDARRIEGTYDTVRGIWWESGWQEKTGGHIAGCEFTVNSAPARRGLVEIDGTAGSMAIRNCTFEVDRRGFWALNAAAPGASAMGGHPDRPWNLTLENLKVIGYASGGVDVHVDGRPGSVVRSVVLNHARGKRRDGLFLANCGDTTLTDVGITTSRYPIWLYTDRSHPTGECFLRIEDGVELDSRGGFGELPRATRLFESVRPGDGGESLCASDPTTREYSAAVSRIEGGAVIGRLLDGPPEYLSFTRRYGHES